MVGNHIKGCEYCSEVTEGAFLRSAYGKRIKIPRAGQKLKKGAKSLAGERPRPSPVLAGLIKRNVWLIAFMSSFAASFFLPRFFLQFLILSVIFGLKWVFDKASTRTLVMIYHAWKRRDRNTDKEIEDILGERLSGFTGKER